MVAIKWFAGRSSEGSGEKHESITCLHVRDLWLIRFKLNSTRWCFLLWCHTMARYINLHSPCLLHSRPFRITMKYILLNKVFLRRWFRSFPVTRVFFIVVLTSPNTSTKLLVLVSGRLVTLDDLADEIQQIKKESSEIGTKVKMRDIEIKKMQESEGEALLPRRFVQLPCDYYWKGYVMATSKLVFCHGPWSSCLPDLSLLISWPLMLWTKTTKKTNLILLRASKIKYVTLSILR
jgi:hypothetical protein